MSNFDLCKTHSELTYLMILLEKNCALERFACRVSQFVRPSSPAPRILLPCSSEIQPQQEQTETDSYYECRAAAGRRGGDQIYCGEEENCGDERERGNCPMHAVPNTTYYGDDAQPTYRYSRKYLVTPSRRRKDLEET